MSHDTPATEQDIERLVRHFYSLAAADPILGPMFEEMISDWEPHIAVVVDFWSSALLGTGRYKGNPFMAHATLPLQPGHFDLWLALFEKATDETLPPAAAEKAMAKARHMARSITVGLFTVPGHRFGKPG
jgi:hemoglobin